MRGSPLSTLSGALSQAMRTCGAQLNAGPWTREIRFCRRNGWGDISWGFHLDRAAGRIWAECVWKIHTPCISQHGQSRPSVKPQAEQRETLLAADQLLGRLESLFQSEIKEERTQKLDTLVFCYSTFTSRPLSLQLLSRKPLAKITGARLRRGQAFTVAVLGEHRTVSKDAWAGGGGGGGVE